MSAAEKDVLANPAGLKLLGSAPPDTQALVSEALAGLRAEVDACRQAWTALVKQRRTLIVGAPPAIVAASEEVERRARVLAEVSAAGRATWEELDAHLQESGHTLAEVLEPTDQVAWDEVFVEARRTRARLEAAVGENERIARDALTYYDLCFQMLAEGPGDDYDGGRATKDAAPGRPRRPLFVDRAV